MRTVNPDLSSSVPGQPRSAGRALNRSALAARAYAAMKAMILDQEVAPGTHVSTDLLTQILGVSQTPVREALARLEGDGLVVRENNGRLRVAALLDRDRFEQFYAVRLALEPLAASLAAAGAAESDLVLLRTSITQMSPAAEQGSSAGYTPFLNADTVFHETIARAGGNGFLADAVHHLHVHHRLAFLYRRRGVTDWQEARQEHTLIADAIAGREAERAGQLMRAHIERSREVLRAGFDSVRSMDWTPKPSHVAAPMPTTP